MNVPMTTSAMRLSALKPTIRASTPTLAMMVPMLTPRRLSPPHRMAMTATYRTRLAVRLSTERARWLAGLMSPSTSTIRFSASRMPNTSSASFSSAVPFTVNTAASSLKSKALAAMPPTMAAASSSAYITTRRGVLFLLPSFIGTLSFSRYFCGHDTTYSGMFQPLNAKRRSPSAAPPPSPPTGQGSVP